MVDKAIAYVHVASYVHTFIYMARNKVSCKGVHVHIQFWGYSEWHVADVLLKK